MQTLDELADNLISGRQNSSCPYLNGYVEQVRAGQMSEEELKGIMRDSLNGVV